MVSRGWGGRRRWAGAFALASLAVLLVGACGSSAPRSQATAGSSDSSSNGATLSTEAARNVAVQTWVRHLASFVAVDATTLPDSEAGFQLGVDKGALPVAIAEGRKENQWQPTGSVTWVALPSTRPQLMMLARIKTTWQPRPSTSLPQTSEDDLVVFARQGVGKKWRIVAYPAIDPAMTSSVDDMRQLKGSYPTRSSSSLPIPPSSLAEKYWTYVSGGANAPFSPGLLTDQRRASLQQTISTTSQNGPSVSFPFESGSLVGTYAVDGNGDGLIAFGARYAELFTAPNGRCIVQSSTQPALTTIVPAGNYAQVRLEFGMVDFALEDKSTGTVKVLADYTVPIGESTTPTQAPACL